MSQPFVDLAAQYRSIKREVDAAIRRVVARGDFIMGEDVKKLEAEVATFVKAKFALGLNSGTDALFAVIRALGIGPGDEVVTTPFTFVATVEMIALAGAKPVFVDIDPKTFNLDVGQLPGAVSRRTRAIIPVHLFGQPADMAPILRLAHRRRLHVIEDAAQAIGSAYRGRMSGTLGVAGCFSFFPSKNLGAYGDGGMVVTNNARVADFVRLWRSHGAPKKYFSDFIGESSRLDTLQAAILRVKLPHLVRWGKKRAVVAGRYDRLLKNLPIGLPSRPVGATHVFHQYTIRVPQGRDALSAHLKALGIPTMVYYPLPIHLQRAYRYLRYRNGAFPEAERAAREVLSLPIYPELSTAGQRRIANAIRSFFSPR